MMVCCDLLSWTICLAALYFVVRKVIGVLRIDRCTDVYVLITGCDTGFGNEAAKRFDRIGCHVFAGCLTDRGKENLKKECSERLYAISLDVSKPESVREAFDYVKSNLPKGRGLWGVINNAGVTGKLGPLEWLSIADYEEVLAINLYGLIDVTMTFLPLVKKARGRIINTSSMSGRYSYPGCTPYTITKYGVEAFTDGLRRSLRPYGVKAVLIEPGAHRTHMISAQNTKNVMMAAWNGASPEAKKEFGEEFLNESIQIGLVAAKKFGSDRILDVVDAYEQGLLCRYPPARYTVGMDCIFFIAMQSLPEFVGDWLMSKLNKGAPKPAILK